jgi:hypothetical protein
MSYTLIDRRELTSAASSVSFENIPQTYTDLLVLFSGRSSTASGSYTANFLRFNGLSTNFSMRRLYGNGSVVGSDSEANVVVTSPRGGSTANTFSNNLIYIANYAASTNKSISLDQVTENNASEVLLDITSGLWSNTAPITSLLIAADSTLVSGSTISLYGVGRKQGPGNAPQAIGGWITQANGYWYHTFANSGSFTPLNNLEVDFLVVAGGGGGGGGYQGGGGGAGGMLESTAIVSAGSYSIVVGAGGRGATSGSPNQSGSNSSAFGLTTTGGGMGAGEMQAFGASGTIFAAGGGSGGGTGHPVYQSAQLGVVGPPRQGFNGGTNWGGCCSNAGGGGAGEAGFFTPSNGNASRGGDGRPSTVTGQGIFYAGGGGGANRSGGTRARGGAGGGGAGGNNDSGTAGTNGLGGGGGGGGSANGTGIGGAGGSGVVVIRYRV